MTGRLSTANLIGVTIAAVAGAAWTLWGASGLHGAASVAVRVAGIVVAVLILIVTLRLRRGASGGQRSMFAARSYRITVAMTVIVRQVHGVKHWRLQEPPTRWPREMPGSGQVYDTPVIAELDLHQGESLVVPRGVVHDAWTTDTASVHITFSGDAPVTWVDVLHTMIDEIAASEETLRAALPWQFARDRAVLDTALAGILGCAATRIADWDRSDLADTLRERHAYRPRDAMQGRMRQALEDASE